MEKLIYKGVSGFNFFICLLSRFICLAGIVFVGSHYHDNPPVIVGFCIVLFLLLLIIGNDKITVYADKVVHSDSALLNYIILSKGKAYPIENIKEAVMPGRAKPGIVNIGVAMAFMMLFPGRTGRRYKSGKFYLELSNSNSIVITTDLDDDQINNIVNAINALIKQKNKNSGNNRHITN